MSHKHVMTHQDIADFNWTIATNEQKCEQYRRMDKYFFTQSNSPMHHNNRCPLHTEEREII